MSGGHRTQRVCACLIRRACRRLPEELREERSAEWTAELPAILADRGSRWPRLRMLLFAVDQARSTRALRALHGRRPFRRLASRAALPKAPSAFELRRTRLWYMGAGMTVLTLYATYMAADVLPDRGGAPPPCACAPAHHLADGDR